MWERFSYYGMRAIFTLYMVNALLFDKAFASKVYGSYTGLVYLTPLLGGYIADRYWGNRKSIIFGGILMAIGQFFMFMSGSLFETVETSKLLMYTGLGFLIFGNGFFKPNISSMVGQLYPEGDSRVDSAFTIFYQGINLGALLAPMVCGNLGEVYDASNQIVPSMFRWGFLAACIGMILSLIGFIWLKNKYVVTPQGEPVGLPIVKKSHNESGTPAAKVSPIKVVIAGVLLLVLYWLFTAQAGFDTIGGIIFSACIVLPGLIISDSSLTKTEKDRIWVIYIVAFFVIFFWSAFEQAGASLTFFAQEQTDRVIFGWNMPASLFQIFNALFIVVLAPVAVSIWGFLNARKKEPASPVKQSLGLAFLALGYLFIAWGVDGVKPWDKVSMIWLIGLYLIHTVGELCLSPIGLSMVVKLAPARFVSLLMGVWFMSTATANKFAGDLSALYPEEVKLEASYSMPSSDLAASLNTMKLAESVFSQSPKDSLALPVAEVKSADGKVVSAQAIPMVQKNVSVYALKLIAATSKGFSNASISEDGQKLFTMKDAGHLEQWNLNPERPVFLGMKISNLYDFFMIFVYMAGVAALILFLLSGRLLKMMHGLR